MIKYEIARQKAVDAWLEATTPRPPADHADVIVQIDRLRDAARERRRLEKSGETGLDLKLSWPQLSMQ